MVMETEPNRMGKGITIAFIVSIAILLVCITVFFMILWLMASG